MEIDVLRDVLRSPVAATMFAISLMLSLLTQTRILSEFDINLDVFALKRGELWRLITGVFYVGNFSLDNMFWVVNNLFSVIQLENGHFAGRKRFFLFFVVYAYLMTLFCVFVLGISFPQRCFYAIYFYEYARVNNERMVLLFGFVPMRAIVALVLELVLSPMAARVAILCGMAVSHMWWFLDSVLPGQLGRPLLPWSSE